jgi:hypothetical protein
MVLVTVSRAGQLVGEVIVTVEPPVVMTVVTVA